jgi:undecaprenyl-diphosphatase
MPRAERLWLALAFKEAALLGGIAAVCLLLWAFVGITDESGEIEHAPLEARILRSFRRPEDPAKLIGPPWMETLTRGISALGGVGVSVMLTVFTAAHLVITGQKLTAAFVTLAVAGGAGLNSLLKYIFSRSRPAVVPYLGELSGASFPSGHSMISIIVYFTLGVLVARSAKSWRGKVCIVAIGGLLSGLVGLSRVMLGVHYPTDVLAGWAAGAIWALLCWIAADLANRWAESRPQHPAGPPAA